MRRRSSRRCCLSRLAGLLRGRNGQQQLVHINLKGLGQAADDGHSWIAHAAFDATDIGAVKPVFQSEALLAQPRRLAQAADIVPEELTRIHRASTSAMTLIRSTDDESMAAAPTKRCIGSYPAQSGFLHRIAPALAAAVSNDVGE